MPAGTDSALQQAKAEWAGIIARRRELGQELPYDSEADAKAAAKAWVKLRADAIQRSRTLDL